MKGKQQTVNLTQTGRGYAVYRWAGNKTISRKEFRTLKEADKAVVVEKRKAFKATGIKPITSGIVKTTKKKPKTKRVSRSRSMFGWSMF